MNLLKIEDEPFVAPLKTNIASQLIEKIIDRSMWQTKRQQRSNLVTMGLLKGYESRGGGI